MKETTNLLNLLAERTQSSKYARTDFACWKIQTPKPEIRTFLLQPESTLQIPSYFLPDLLTAVLQKESWLDPRTGMEQLLHLKAKSDPLFAPLFFQAILEFSRVYQAPLPEIFDWTENLDDPRRTAVKRWLEHFPDPQSAAAASTQAMDMLAGLFFEGEQKQKLLDLCRKKEPGQILPVLPAAERSTEQLEEIVLFWRQQRLHFSVEPYCCPVYDWLENHKQELSQHFVRLLEKNTDETVRKQMECL